jgi:hypothetical protein
MRPQLRRAAFNKQKQRGQVPEDSLKDVSIAGQVIINKVTQRTQKDSDARPSDPAG